MFAIGKRTAVVALVAAMAVGGSLFVAMRASATSRGKAPRAIDVYVTYYGWYDNTPPGCATAYSGCARGTGTYSHPITFASYKKEFPVGTILYYPTLEKYVVMGDLCQECQQDWTGKGPDGGPHLYHVDIWSGGKNGNEFDAINCEDALTQGMPNGSPLLTPMIVNPPSDLPVDPVPIFNARTGACFGGAVTETTHGRYRNQKTGRCLANTSGKTATTAPCDKNADEDLAFDGAFLSVHHRCFEASKGKAGALMVFAPCNGNPNEQWEINPNGTITWIQYTLCVADVGGKIYMDRCTGASNEQWRFEAKA